MALYHTHRPQTFASVVGQDHIVKTIENQIKTGNVAHAYLFTGPRGIGKTTTARLLAKALNCENRKAKDTEPCNECSTCKEISAGRSIDVMEVDAASQTGVDNVRDNIIENAHFHTSKSTYKIFIIDEVHMLSSGAFNALLKTLEEPPAKVIFILATTELHKVPETIISRCQQYNFKKVSYEILQKHLAGVAKIEKVKIADEVLDRIVNKSDGCVRDAVGLLDQIMAIGEKNITPETASIVLPTSNVADILNFVTALINSQVAVGLDILNELNNQGVRFTQFAEDCLELVRVILIIKATDKEKVPGTDYSAEVRQDLKKLAQSVAYNDLIKVADILLKRRLEIQSSPLPQLPLELALIEWSLEGPKQNATQSSSTTPNTAKIVDKSESVSDQPTVAPKYEIKEDSATKKITEKMINLVTRDKEPVCDLETAKDKWPELLKLINGDSPSLTSVLKMADILEVLGNTLKIGVEYSFHKDKLNEKKCKKQVEEYLSQVFATKVHIEAVVKEVTTATTDNEELQELAAAFGGEVVG